jgi:flavin-binding protein dodecin
LPHRDPLVISPGLTAVALIGSSKAVAVESSAGIGVEESRRQRPRPPRAVVPSRRYAVSVYKVIEIIGTSDKSWEDAATEAVKTAGASLRELRVAEVVQQDLNIADGGAVTFRTKLSISFKYEGAN